MSYIALTGAEGGLTVTNIAEYFTPGVPQYNFLKGVFSYVSMDWQTMPAGQLLAGVKKGAKGSKSTEVLTWCTNDRHCHTEKDPEQWEAADHAEDGQW